MGLNLDAYYERLQAKRLTISEHTMLTTPRLPAACSESRNDGVAVPNQALRHLA
jgi:hypothetical protein